MVKALKTVNFYNSKLLEGCLHNLRMDASGALRPVERGKPAVCLAAMYDTGDEGCTFNRLVVDGQFQGARLELIVAAASAGAAREERLGRLYDPEFPVGEKVRLLRALPHVQAHAQDVLLHRLCGQCLLVLVGVYPAGDCDFTLRGLRMEFPRESFLRYLPAVYRDNGFFERYIAIFQSLYLDLERRADELPQLLETEGAPDAQVERLAGWLGLDACKGLFTAEQLRRMIARLELFQGKKGTRAALEAALELAGGGRPRIVEWFEWRRFPMPAALAGLYERLYGQGEGGFCVLTDAQSADGRRLERVLEEFSPIGTPHRLVRIRKCSAVDGHCYLDRNGVLAVPEQAAAENGLLDTFITLA